MKVASFFHLYIFWQWFGSSFFKINRIYPSNERAFCKKRIFFCVMMSLPFNILSFFLPHHMPQDIFIIHIKTIDFSVSVGCCKLRLFYMDCCYKVNFQGEKVINFLPHVQERQQPQNKVARHASQQH